MPKRKRAEDTPPKKRSLEELIQDSQRLRERAAELMLEAERLTESLRANALMQPARRTPKR